MPRPLKKPRGARGQHLANLRRAAGLTQTALAELINQPQPTVAAWEVSDRLPRASMLPKLAKALGVSVEQILNVEPVMPSKKRGPVSKVGRLFEEVSNLPPRQQEKIVEFVSALLTQFKQHAA